MIQHCKSSFSALATSHGQPFRIGGYLHGETSLTGDLLRGYPPCIGDLLHGYPPCIGDHLPGQALCVADHFPLGTYRGAGHLAWLTFPGGDHLAIRADCMAEHLVFGDPLWTWPVYPANRLARAISSLLAANFHFSRRLMRPRKLELPLEARALWAGDARE